MAEKIVYLNGSFVPESEAKVSVLDSGFNAGDGVYDVTRTFDHKPFRLRDHTARLSVIRVSIVAFRSTIWKESLVKYSSAIDRCWQKKKRSRFGKW
jgi:hypothetical protein